MHQEQHNNTVFLCDPCHVTTWTQSRTASPRPDGRHRRRALSDLRRGSEERGCPPMPPRWRRRSGKIRSSTGSRRRFGRRHRQKLLSGRGRFCRARNRYSQSACLLITRRAYRERCALAGDQVGQGHVVGCEAGKLCKLVDAVLKGEQAPAGRNTETYDAAMAPLVR